jgi:hypothetical protein
MGAKPPAIAALTGDGDFYVEPDCCLLCGVPEDIAPEVFQTGENYCFVKQQPCSQDELDRTIRAMWSSEVDCIRYRGQDAELLARLARGGMSDQADHPHQLNARSAPPDQVSFSLPQGGAVPAFAAQIAEVFRTDMRANGSSVLPALFGPRTVWISWFQYRFHGVRFINARNGRIVAQLRSRTALQGLAWLVDDWLRTKEAGGIRWEATGDAASARPKPM